MRNFSFALICVFFVALTIGALVYAFHIQAELEAIRRENRALIESMQPSGGAETTVQDAPTGTGYQFPIHPDDYLMLTSAPG